MHELKRTAKCAAVCILASIAIAALLGMTGCGSEAEAWTSDRFRVDHEEYCYDLDGDILILTDTETGVRYISIGGEGITPLLDPDGTFSIQED